jgi:tetratricopeptide (TPR) repeat protein
MRSSGRIGEAIALLTARFPDASGIEAPRIAMMIGHLHEGGNSPDEAMSWYRKTLASKDPEVAGDAAFALGHLLEETGAIADAEAAYAEAMCFRGEGPAAAGLALAHILMSRGDQDAARAALRFAATSDSWLFATTALYQLGLILKETGNTWGAKLLLERVREDLSRAVTDSDLEMAALGHLRLGNVLLELEEVQEAVENYRSAYNSRVAGVWPQAAANLAVLVSSANTSESSEILQLLADHAEDGWIAWIRDQIQNREEI